LAADTTINREKPRRIVNLSQQEAVEKSNLIFSTSLARESERDHAAVRTMLGGG
jgi:hypothetical protein